MFLKELILRRLQMVSKRGLSAVVITLIMILLALVVAGIIWVVVNNLAEQGSEQIENSARCLESRVEVTDVDCDWSSGDSFNTCDVTVKRSQGTDEIAGVKIILADDSGQQIVNTTIGDIDVLATTRQQNIDVSSIGNITEVKAAVYFTNNAGDELPCGEGIIFDDISVS